MQHERPWYKIKTLLHFIEEWNWRHGNTVQGHWLGVWFEWFISNHLTDILYISETEEPSFSHVFVLITELIILK